MDEFLRDGESVLEAARHGGEAGALAIVIGRDGSLRGVPGSGWTLEALQAEHGARAVYRVSRTRTRLRVEGRSGARSLVLEEETAPAAGGDRLAHRPLALLP
ncbi:MAG TPA: hypothetical protein VLH09_10440 [Bryobacteraceae bacterium]|nr:hypothetical protein [Bryobacteraceae bacterium]